MNKETSFLESKLKIPTTIVVVFVALTILSTSILRSASIKYSYTPMVLSDTSENLNNDEQTEINYVLAYPGKIGPDSPLWYLKAARDRIWSIFTFDESKKAELNLLFADKRLLSSAILFQENKPDLGMTTLLKAEKYLEASSNYANSDDVHMKLALASLKHKEIVERQILPNAPEDLRPQIIKTMDITNNVYEKSKVFLLTNGLIPPQNTLK